MMEIKAFYRCPVCNKEYENYEDALACAKKPKKKHKYKIGSIVLIKISEGCSPYPAVIVETSGHERHEPKYVIDPRDGITTYNVIESQIVKEVMPLEVLNKREIALNTLVDECKHRIKDLFGTDCKIDDYSHVTWDEGKVATVKFYIEK